MSNVFLHESLDEIVYMHQPLGFCHPKLLDHVCVLKISLYGLKQALCPGIGGSLIMSLQWDSFTAFMIFHYLFIYHNGNDMAYILLYVDDIILIASSDSLREHIMSKLSSEFAMKDLGPLSYFLGISVIRHSGGIFLSQKKYAEEIIERVGISSCNPSPTPVDTKSKLSGSSCNPYFDPTEYRSLAGAL